MKKAVWFLALGQTMLWCCLYYVFPATLLHWESAHGWSRSDITLALTFAVGVSAIVAPFAGRIIDRGYGSLMMTLSATAGGVLLYLISITDTLFSFYILWSTMGLAMAGCLYEPCFAFLVHCMKAGAKRSITLITLMAGFASTICFPSVHYLHEHFGIESTLQVFSICVIVVAVPLMFFGSQAVARDYRASSVAIASSASTDKIENLPHFLTSPLFWLLACGFSMLALNHGVVLNHLLPLMSERALPDSLAVLVISLIGPMQVAGRLVWMLVDRHWSVMKITVLCFVSVTTATLCLIASSSATYLVFVFVLLQGSAYGVLSIVKPLTTREVMGDLNFGAIAGALAVPYLLAFATSPYIGSLIWQLGGYNYVLWAIWGFALLGVISIIVVYRLHVHRQATRKPNPQLV